ncbi:MAG: tyrosine-type recombinase/integrase [Nitrososphaeria archaeon]
MTPYFDESKNDVFRVMDVHSYGRRVAVVEAKLKGPNGEVAKAFLNHLRIKGKSEARLHFYASRMSKILGFLNRKGLRLQDVQRKDVEEFLGYVLSQPFKAWTKHAYVLAFKKLVSYAKTGDSDNAPPEVAWIRPHAYSREADRESRARPEALLTEEEVLKIISCARNMRDRAMLWVHFEGALRPGELLTMKVSSVEFRDQYCLVSVQGKTGLKRLPLVFSFRPLLDWLNVHPLKDDPNAPLWASLSRSRYGKGVCYHYFRNMVKRCAEEAGLKKAVWPYLFRHTQLTRMAKKLTEAKLALYAGWVQGSNMAKKYVHFSARDLEETILEINGLKKPEEEHLKLQLRRCPRCGEEHTPEVKRCKRCGLILDPVLATKTALKDVERQDEVLERIKKIESQIRSLLSSPSNSLKNNIS